jgi:predicted lipoprotein
MKKSRLLIVLMCLVFAVMMSGCVKVVQIGHEDELTGTVRFNAAKDVEKIWSSKVIPDLTKKAVDLPTFFKESNGDFKKLASKYGKYSMGTSGELSYAVKGTGTVTEVNQERQAGFITVKLDGYDGPVVVKLQIGSVYKGSALRDSLSFIKFEDYTNQVDWAKVSQSLHDMVNKAVIGKVDLKTLKGKKVSFVGSFSVDKPTEILITPVELKVQ